MARLTVLAGVVAAVVAAGSWLATASGSGSKRAASTPAQYCRTTGGVVKVRVPTFDTNGPPSTWLPLGGSAAFCEWTAKDGSQITTTLSTLYSKKPTLAAIAYLTAPKPGRIQCCANPASLYCAHLGGSDSFGGMNAAGGGWVAVGSKDDIAQVCVFPDGSAIDSFGIFYKTAHIVRGRNLATVLRYHPAHPPPLFGP